MRRPVMRFNGILRGKRSTPLDSWIDDAIDSEITPIMRFVRVLRRDIDAIELPWSNGQADGQTNRLKTLKRAMYGRAGPELMRARMLPPRPGQRNSGVVPVNTNRGKGVSTPQGSAYRLGGKHISSGRRTPDANRPVNIEFIRHSRQIWLPKTEGLDHPRELRPPPTALRRDRMGSLMSNSPA
tara:strand:- start:1009 stop:1557 length:549 start_codon:yes stop_codon:yes gene_type:complete